MVGTHLYLYICRMRVLRVDDFFCALVYNTDSTHTRPTHSLLTSPTRVHVRFSVGSRTSPRSTLIYVYIYCICTVHSNGSQYNYTAHSRTHEETQKKCRCVHKRSAQTHQIAAEHNQLKRNGEFRNARFGIFCIANRCYEKYADIIGGRVFW